MSFISLGGQSYFLWPSMGAIAPVNGFITTGLIDATGEKVAISGRVWFSDGVGSKSIRRVQFRFGTVVKAGGSALTISLQNVSSVSGPPLQPTEVPDQTVAVANADAGFVSNNWYRTNAFSADRLVNFGDQVSIVIEYDGAGRLGADSVIVNGIASLYGGGVESVLALKAPTWAALTGVPNVILEFSDGTYGTLMGSAALSAASSTAYNLNTVVADEYGNRFIVPFACEVDGIYAHISTSSNPSVEFSLYNGTTLLAVSSVNSTQFRLSGTLILCIASFPKVALAANTPYYVTARVTNTNNLSILYYETPDVNFFDVMEGSKDIYSVRRIDQGAWSDPFISTRRYCMGVKIRSIDSGAGMIMSRIQGGM